MKRKAVLVGVMAALASLSSVAMAVPYASGVSQAGNTVSFILNQNASNVVVYRDGGSPVFPGTTAGTLNFDMTGYSSYEIVVSGSEGLGWSQYVPDQTNTSFYAPCGISINKDPSSPNFGKAYVSETQTATTAYGRSMTSGIYMLNADGSNAGWADGGVNWTAAGTSSPFKSTIGPDGHLYVTDYSNDLLYEFSADMSTATVLIDATNKTAGQYVEGVHVEGTQAGGDRKLYLVNSHYTDARRGLIEYNLDGNATATSGDTGTQIVGPSYFAFYPRDVARDSNGDWYMNQFRYSPNQAPPVSKFLDEGVYPINTADWESDMSVLGYNGAYGIDINEAAGIVAYGNYYNGFVYILDMDTGVILDQFDAGSRLRELAFDAAGNLVTLDSSTEWARFWSPGGGSIATTRSDGTFTLVPEPATLGLIALGGLALLRRRR